MGTHPIFESDFDCLTDLIRTTIHNGPYLSHRRRRLQVLALRYVLQACPAQAHQDGDQGREEGQRRCCREAGRWRQERRCPPGHLRQAAQVLPNSVGPPQDQGSRPEAILPALPRPSSPPPPSWTCPKLPFPTTSTTPISSAPPPPRRPRRASSRRRTRSTPLPSSARPIKRPSMPVS